MAGLTNTRTGCKRRRRTFETASNKRSQALDASSAMLLENIHDRIDDALEQLAFANVLFQMSQMAWLIFGDEHVAWLVLQAIICVLQQITEVMILMEHDSDLADIQPEEELPRGHSLFPKRHPSIMDYNSDDQAMLATNFRIGELMILKDFFQLGQAQQLDGFIRINDYKFTGDEILLFVLTKITSGATTEKHCNQAMFGGDARRWSLALNWFYRRAQPRIQPFISFELLNSHRLLLRGLAETIADRIRSGFNVENPVTHEIEFVPGIDYNNANDPFKIFGFLDCSLFETSTPGTGPRGRYEGAARNEDAYDTQRAVYTGWKCLHGVKMLTVVLPNGLQVVHGPISARQNDLASVHLSGLDLYLHNLQQNLQYLIELQPGNNIQYCAYGDGIFHPLAQPDNCIRSYHRGTIDAPLTDIQRHENRIMKKIRVLIEHTYGRADSHFPILNVKSQWKLENTESELATRMQFIFFLENLLTCIHGNSMSKAFELMPPTLERFLEMNL